MPDRSGGREVKGASLKQSKKNPGCPTANKKKATKVEPTGPSYSLPPPICKNGRFIDCGAALLSRQFDRDRERVISRAESEDVGCIITWFSDIEKLSSLTELAKENSGLCYYLAGAHPDNVDKTNKKSHEGWMEKVDEAARKPECLGILTGLNLTREMATHFSQESLLKSSCQLADKLLLPIVAHVAPDGESLEKLVEILQSQGWTTNYSDSAVEITSAIEAKRLILYDAVMACGGDINKLQMTIKAGFYFIVSSHGLTDGDDVTKEKSKLLIKSIPLDKLLICSDSPWKTPQNISDSYVRSQRNEPSNIKYVYSAVYSHLELLDISELEFIETVRSNTLRVFGMEFISASSFDSNSKHSSAAACSAMKSDDSNLLAKPSPPLPSDLNVLGTIQRKTTFNPSSLEIQEIAEKVEKLEKVEADCKEYYGCIKCRARLFKSLDVLIHAKDAAKSTIFKVGEEGLCQTAVFLKCEDYQDLSKRTSLVARSGNVECTSCGIKLGRFYDKEAHCSCGVTIAGPVARLLSNKLDYFDGITDPNALAARARNEAEETSKYADDFFMDENFNKKVKKGTKTRVKHKSERGKGNFSEFRNKTFITPGMKVARNDNNENKRAPTIGKKKRIGRTDKNDSEDEDDDDDDDDNDNDDDDNSLNDTNSEDENDSINDIDSTGEENVEDVDFNRLSVGDKFKEGKV